MIYFLQQVSTFFQWVLNFTLFSIGIVLTVAVLNTAFYIVTLIPGLFTTDVVYTTFLEEIINFFLFFEFLSLVVKYFKNNYHFPLRYFIYIGITAIIRLIIVQHDDPKSVLIWAGAILLLVISLAIAEKFIKKD